MARAGEVLENPIIGQRIILRKTASDSDGELLGVEAGRHAGLEWFVSAVLALTGITVFRNFAEKTPIWRRLSKWAFYFGVTALLSRGPGRPWTFAWIIGLPGVALAFHLWWCKKHGIDPLTAEPKERYYELMGWGTALKSGRL